MAIAFACGSARAAEIVVVDDFTDASAAWPQFATLATDLEVDEAATSALGGYRETIITVDTGSFTVGNVDTVAEAFDYAAVSGTAGQLELSYLGTAADDTFDLNFDATGLQGFEVVITGYDYPEQQPLEVTFRFTDGVIPVGDSDVQTASATQTINAAGDTTLVFDVADFGDLSDFDLADLDGLGIVVDAPAAADFRVESVTAVVPEPASLALISLGGLMMFRRRRNA